MRVYYIMGPNGKRTFEVDGRLEEIIAGLNPHPHWRNYSRHSGRGSQDGTAHIPPHLERMGYAAHQLPAQPPDYWTEAVWNRSDLPADTNRVILGQGGEIYFTNDHYQTYYKVFALEGEPTHTVFNDNRGKHTRFL